jgi:ankyrin repeat protein
MKIQCLIAGRPVSQLQGIFEDWDVPFADTVTDFGERPSTPPGIAVFTPINSPSPSHEMAAVVPVFEMPWTHFRDLMSSMTLPDRDLRKNSRSDHTQDKGSDSCKRDICRYLSVSAQSRDTNRGLKPIMLGSEAPLILQKPQIYLPKASIGSLGAHIHDSVGLSNRMRELDMMMFLVGLASNNIGTQEIINLVMELVEDESCGMLFKRLLAEKLDTVSAFAEKLLVPAARHQKWDLMEVLIESGIDVDTRSDCYDTHTTLASSNGYITHSATALQYAVDHGNIEMVKYLIEREATDFSAFYQSRSGRFCRGTILDLAVDRGHQSLVRYVLADPGRFPKITTFHLRHAILLGHIEMVRLLLDSPNGLCKAAGGTPWLFFEAAAVCEDEDQAGKLVYMLLSYDFDIASMDAFGRGSILAAASVVPHMTMIKRLLTEGFHTGSVALGHIDRLGNPLDGYETYALALTVINSKSALHVAVSRGHEELVSLLLNYGADANQYCGLYPIQRAALKGNAMVARLLIELGADVNATQHRDESSAFESAYSPFPAILLALLQEHIEVAELLHRAGAMICDDVEECAYKEFMLARLVERGSQSLIFSIIGRLLPGKKLANKHADVIARRFDVDFMASLVHTGIKVIRVPSIYAFIAGSGHPSQCSDRESYSFGSKESLEQQVMGCIDEDGGLSPSHGLRALILAVRGDLERIILILLHAGFNPFEPIADAADDILSEVDSRYRFRKGESAFIESVVRIRRNVAKIFLDWNSDSLSAEKYVLRIRQTCKASILALCRDCDYGWLRELLFNDVINYQVAQHVLGRGYIKKCLFGELYDAISVKLYSAMDRILQDGSPFVDDLVNLPARIERTPLQLAAEQQNSQLLRTLLDMGADVNAKADDLRGATALQFAAMNGNFEIVDMLIGAGADINAPHAKYQGRTAVEGAAEWGRLDMVHYLLEAGANIQLRKNYRRTVYRAYENGHRAIAHMVYRWKKEKYGDEDCEAPESVVKTMTQLELDGEIPAECDSEEDLDESDIDSPFDPLARYRELRRRRRKLREVLLGEQERYRN